MHDKGANSVVTPGVKEDSVSDDTPLEPSMSSLYRSLTMRINYLAQDRADLQYAGKELARAMAAPTVSAWNKLKRVGRYLVGRPRMVLFLPHSEMDQQDRLSCRQRLCWMLQNEKEHKWRSINARATLHQDLELESISNSIILRRGRILRDGQRMQRNARA